MFQKHVTAISYDNFFSDTVLKGIICQYINALNGFLVARVKASNTTYTNHAIFENNYYHCFTVNEAKHVQAKKWFTLTWQETTLIGRINDNVCVKIDFNSIRSTKIAVIYLFIYFR